MIVDKMKELGFTEEQINKILIDYSICRMRKNKIYQSINEVLDYLKNYGFNDEDIVKISKMHPQIFSYSASNLSQKILFFKNLGYEKVEILKMVKKSPQILSISLENILDKIYKLEGLGYTRSQILHTIYRFPQLLTLSNKYVLNKFNDLKGLGYNPLEVIKVTTMFPNIWSIRIENIKEKKEFYDLLGISNFILVKPNLLMQSIELTYARYMFFMSMGEKIDSNTYRSLFWGQSYFEKKYQKTKQELIEEYPYDREELKKRIKK